MLSCVAMHDLKDLYQNDALPADTRLAVSRHLQECGACRRFYSHPAPASRQRTHGIRRYAALLLTAAIFLVSAGIGYGVTRQAPWERGPFAAAASAFVHIGKSVTVDNTEITLDRVLLDRVATYLFFTAAPSLPAGQAYDVALRDNMGGTYALHALVDYGRYWQAELDPVAAAASGLMVAISNPATGRSATINITLPTAGAVLGTDIFPPDNKAAWGPLQVRIKEVSYGTVETRLEFTVTPAGPLLGLGAGFSPYTLDIPARPGDPAAEAESWPLAALEPTSSRFQSPWTADLLGSSPHDTSFTQADEVLPTTTFTLNAVGSTYASTGTRALRLPGNTGISIHATFPAALNATEPLTLQAPRWYAFQPVNERVIIPRTGDSDPVPAPGQFQAGDYWVVIEAARITDQSLVVVYHLEDTQHQLVKGVSLLMKVPTLGYPSAMYVHGDAYLAAIFNMQDKTLPAGPIELCVTGLGQAFGGEPVTVNPPAAGASQ